MSTDKENTPIKPLRVFLFLLSIHVFLGAFILIFPSGEIKITDNFTLSFIPKDEVLHGKDLVVVDIDSVITDIDPIDSLDNLQDSALRAKLANEKYDAPAKRRIQFPSNNKAALDLFFEALMQTEKTGKLIRIAHYGDSQIEGDRISDYLRNRLQLKFGGYGPGIILPIDYTHSRITVRQDESGDWKKFAIFGNLKRLKNGKYGLGGSAYRFTGSYIKKTEIEEDSTTGVLDTNNAVDDSTLAENMKVDSDTSENDSNTKEPLYIEEEITVDASWMSFKPGKYTSYSRVKRFKRISLLYGNNPANTVAQIKIDNHSFKDTIRKTNGFKMLTWDKGFVNNEFRITFLSKTSPDVYGVMLDGDSGIAVDNFAMRGSAGIEFERMDKNFLQVQMNAVNTKLIILQYGINVVPGVKKSYKWYETWFYKQLKMFKTIFPERSIMVVGLSDMSTKKGTDYVTYPNVPLIRDAMKNAAFKSGSAFFDLYEAMGGENSMVSWVNAKPPLAGLDYTHFTSKGAQYVGEMLYNALMYEYTEWKKKQLGFDTPKKDTTVVAKKDSGKTSAASLKK